MHSTQVCLLVLTYVMLVKVLDLYCDVTWLSCCCDFNRSRFRLHVSSSSRVDNQNEISSYTTKHIYISLLSFDWRYIDLVV